MNQAVNIAMLGMLSSARTALDAIGGQWRVLNRRVGSAKWDPSATLLSGKRVLVAGGARDSDDTPVATVEMRDPATDVWSIVAPLPEQRVYSSAATLVSADMAVVTGGQSDSSVTSSTIKTTTYVYDPATNTWSTQKAMPQHRRSHLSIDWDNNSIITVGGVTNTAGTFATQCLIYDYDTNLWSNGPVLPMSQNPAFLAKLGGGTKLVVMRRDAFHIYDKTSGTWSTGPTYPGEVHGSSDTCGTNLTDSEILLVHGIDTFRYSENSNGWTQRALNPNGVGVPNALGRTPALPIEQGHVLLVLGGRSTYAAQGVAEFIDSDPTLAGILANLEALALLD